MGRATPAYDDRIERPIDQRMRPLRRRLAPRQGTAKTAKPSSRQLGDWLWNETAAGAAIHAVRVALQASEDERLKLIVSNFMVPAARVRTG